MSKDILREIKDSFKGPYGRAEGGQFTLTEWRHPFLVAGASVTMLALHSGVSSFAESYRSIQDAHTYVDVYNGGVLVGLDVSKPLGDDQTIPERRLCRFYRSEVTFPSLNDGSSTTSSGEATPCVVVLMHEHTVELQIR